MNALNQRKERSDKKCDVLERKNAELEEDATRKEQARADLEHTAAQQNSEYQGLIATLQHRCDKAEKELQKTHAVCDQRDQELR